MQGIKTNSQASEILLYISQDWTIQFDVPVKKETVWINRQQMAVLFDRDVKTIGKHINNIFREWALKQDWVIAKIATTATDGKIYQVEYYNLDVIISVWYRVKSLRWIQFRIWATQRLKEYVLKWYTVNRKKLLEIGFEEFEQTLALIKKTVSHSLYHTKTEWMLNFITQYEEVMENIQKVRAILLLQKEVFETSWKKNNDWLKGVTHFLVKN